MESTWDESFWERGQQDGAVYWVCFWTEHEEWAPSSDPQRIDGARSVTDVLDWIEREKGSRGWELFVETVGQAESREHGWVETRGLIKLAGDFDRSATTVTIVLTAVRDDAED